jgi:hypothetical protein
MFFGCLFLGLKVFTKKWISTNMLFWTTKLFSELICRSLHSSLLIMTEWEVYMKNKLDENYEAANERLRLCILARFHRQPALSSKLEPVLNWSISSMFFNWASLFNFQNSQVVSFDFSQLLSGVLTDLFRFCMQSSRFSPKLIWKFHQLYWKFWSFWHLSGDQPLANRSAILAGIFNLWHNCLIWKFYQLFWNNIVWNRFWHLGDRSARLADIGISKSCLQGTYVRWRLH